MDYFAAALERHRLHQGKIEVRSRMRLESVEDLSLAYTPGVAAPCEAIAARPAEAWDLTWKGRTVAVVSFADHVAAAARESGACEVSS